MKVENIAVEIHHCALQPLVSRKCLAHIGEVRKCVCDPGHGRQDGVAKLDRVGSPDKEQLDGAPNERHSIGLDLDKRADDLVVVVQFAEEASDSFHVLQHFLRILSVLHRLYRLPQLINTRCPKQVSVQRRTFEAFSKLLLGGFECLL